jgi:hypothetical protein
VAGVIPLVRKGLELVGFAVAVGVGQARQFGPLGDDDLVGGGRANAHWFIQPGCKQFPPIIPLRPDFTASRTDHDPAVGHQSHAAYFEDEPSR